MPDDTNQPRDGGSLKYYNVESCFQHQFLNLWETLTFIFILHKHIYKYLYFPYTNTWETLIYISE